MQFKNNFNNLINPTKTPIVSETMLTYITDDNIYVHHSKDKSRFVNFAESKQKIVVNIFRLFAIPHNIKPTSTFEQTCIGYILKRFPMNKFECKWCQFYFAWFLNGIVSAC